MPTPLKFILIVALGLALASALHAYEERARRRADRSVAEEIDLDALLWAIRQVETGDNPRAIGPHSERSAYQFTRATWSHHTPRDFMFASTMPHLADEIARKHARWVIRQLQRRTLNPVTPATFALTWRHGLDGKWTATDYAARVEALYQDRVTARPAAP